MDNLTVIIVSYETPHLLWDCVQSIRKFYPKLKIIIVDGSKVGSGCWGVCKEFMLSDYYMVKFCGYNVGHGNGMKMGIEICNTDYFLLMDSDTELKTPALESILKLFEIAKNNNEPLYGVGQVVSVNSEGGNDTRFSFPYLHPHFAMIDRQQYLKHDPIINHGAPLIKAMRSIKSKNLLADIELSDIVLHKERGTRNLNPVEFNPANWDKI